MALSRPKLGEVTADRVAILLVTSVVFGCLMGARYDVESSGIRALLAALAFVVLGVGIRQFRRRS